MAKPKKIARTVYFSRIKTWNTVTGEYLDQYPHQRLFLGGDIREQNKEALKNPLELSGKKMIALVDPCRNPKLTNFRLGSLKESDLPLLLSQDELGDLDGSLVNLSHIVIFKDDLVAMVRQHMAPREAALQRFLQYKLDKMEIGRYEVGVYPLLKEDFYERLDRLKVDAQRIEISFNPSEYARLKKKGALLSEVLPGEGKTQPDNLGERFAKRSNAQSAKLFLSAGRASLNLSYLKRWIMRTRGYDVVDQIKITERGNPLEIKLTRDVIKTKNKFVAADGNRVSDIKAYAGIREAYNEVLDELYNSPTLLDDEYQPDDAEPDEEDFEED